ncbi:hypothetical protein HJC23_007064 [Cyclotella cryptica]|uniref:Transmembrane protein 18 n=1 Tax=Cyclotella cryptica TaxID=29204 RepID=A0ABD3PAT0_9STRA|eukprot:CCRYP_016472-RB/>CCRYP_016472-RB protein AED:0.35 eAED:0.35 QI:261/1/1/1/0.33/0.25/4/881/224
MASLFKSLSEDMEKIAQVVEEGTKIIFGTSTLNEDTSGQSADAGAFYNGDEDGFYEDGEEMQSPLMGMADSVISDIMSSQSIGPQTAMENIQAFSAAITWGEPFIRYLLAFHMVVIVTAYVLMRKDIYLRMGFMIFLGLIIRMAEQLNQLGNRRWRDFATQNYFDKNGIFMGIMICAPLLIICFIMLVSLIREAKNLLVDVKKMKIQAKENAKKKKADKRKKKD